MLLWCIALPLAVWLGLVGYVGVNQASLLYFPTRLSDRQAEALAQREGAVAMRDATGTLLGWRFAAADGATCTSEWLLAHGNGGMALDRAYMVERLRIAVAAGACLSILEYPGYGAADGAPSRIEIMRRARLLLAQVQAASAAMEPPPPLLLIGESLGTGVVAELAESAPGQVAGLLLLTPYEDLAAVASDHFPWLPASVILRDRFRPAQALADYPGPVQLIVAGADTLIPPPHAQALAAALRQPRMHVEPGLDHNQLERRPGWWSQVRALLPGPR